MALTDSGYQWYQTDTAVVVSIMKRGVDPSTVQVNFTDRTVEVVVKSDTIQHLNLANNIDPSKSSYKVMSMKIELKLAKVVSAPWSCIEGEDPKASLKIIAPSSGDSGISVEPSGSPAKSYKKWDNVAKEADEIEEGDPLNNLFQKIFKDANDDTKRAMIKSFTESGGTVLSTNWADVGKSKVDMKPPDGMEYKEYPK